jgi:hypothetical protein
MTNYARGITVPQDRHGLIGALRIGLHQDKLSVVNKRRGMSSDDVVRQVIVLQLGLKSVDNGAAVRLRNQIGAVLAQNRFPQQSPGARNGIAPALGLFCQDRLIKNGVLESGGG